MADFLTSNLFLLWASTCPLLALRVGRRPWVAAGFTSLSGGMVLAVLYGRGYAALAAAGWSAYGAMVIGLALLSACAVQRRTAKAA